MGKVPARRGRGRGTGSRPYDRRKERAPRDDERPGSSRDTDKPDSGKGVKAQANNFAKVTPKGVPKGTTLIPRVRGGALRRSFVHFYNKDVLSTDAAIYHTTGEGSALTTDEIIRMKRQGDPRAREYTSNLKEWDMESKVGQYTQARSVVFDNSDLRTSFEAAGIKWYDTQNAAKVPRVISVHTTESGLVDIREKFIDPLYEQMLSGRIIREWASSHVRVRSEGKIMTAGEFIQQHLDHAGVTLPCVSVRVGTSDNAVSLFYPIVGTESMAYKQSKYTLTQQGCDDVTYHALVLQYQAILNTDTSEDAAMALKEIEAIAASFLVAASTHFFGAGTASGAAGRVAQGLTIHREALEAWRKLRDPNGPPVIGKDLINDAGFTDEALSAVFAFRDFNFTTPLSSFPEDAMDWFSYLKEVNGVQVHSHFLGIEYKDVQGKRHKILKPLFTQNPRSDPGAPWGNTPVRLRYKKGNVPPGPKKEHTRLQNQIMTSVVNRLVDLQTPTAVRRAILGHVDKRLGKAKNLASEIESEADSSIPPLLSGSLAFLRPAKIKQKPEFMTLEKGSTKSRLICVPSPVTNINSNEFFRPMKEVLMSQIKGFKHGISMLGWSPAHEGAAVWFERARETVQDPDKTFCSSYGDNLTVIENGQCACFDASSMEASQTEETIRSVTSFVARHFWGASIDSKGVVINGGHNSRSSTNYMVNAFPTLATHAQGVMLETGFDWNFMLSGIGGTTELNTALMGVFGYAITRDADARHAERRKKGEPWRPSIIKSDGSIHPRVFETAKAWGLKLKVEAVAHDRPYHHYDPVWEVDEDGKQVLDHDGKPKPVWDTLASGELKHDSRGRPVQKRVYNKKLSRTNPVSFAKAERNPYTLKQAGLDVPVRILGMYMYAIDIGPEGSKERFYGCALEKDRAMLALTFNKARALLSGDGPRVQSDLPTKGIDTNTLNHVVRMLANKSVAMMTIDPLILEGFRLSNLRHAHLLGQSVRPGTIGELQLVMEMADATHDMLSDFVGKELMEGLKSEIGITDYSSVVQLLTHASIPFYETVRVMLGSRDRVTTRTGSDGRKITRPTACEKLIQEVESDHELLKQVHRWLPYNVIGEMILRRPELTEKLGGPIPTAVLARGQEMLRKLQEIYAVSDDRTDVEQDEESEASDGGDYSGSEPDEGGDVEPWSDESGSDAESSRSRSPIRLPSIEERPGPSRARPTATEVIEAADAESRKRRKILPEEAGPQPAGEPDESGPSYRPRGSVGAPSGGRAYPGTIRRGGGVEDSSEEEL